MKSLSDNIQAPDISIDPSISEQYESDQEMEPNIASSNREMLINKSSWMFCPAIDLCLIRQVLAEALGTFILMFCICGIIASMQLMGVEVGLMQYAATAALTVMILVFSVGPISGAHVNPAVTIALAAVGPFPWPKVTVYILAQLGGSMLATYLGKLIYGVQSELMMTRPLQSCSSAFWVEFIATLIILFLVASLSNDPESIGHLAGFIIGVAIGLGVLITGPVSGGSMNPARSIGPAIISRKFDHLWIYCVAPTAGAVAGVVLYRILRLQGWSCNPQSPHPKPCLA